MTITWIECHFSWFLGGFLSNSSLGRFPDQESSDRTLPWFSGFLPSLLRCSGAKLIRFFPFILVTKTLRGPNTSSCDPSSTSQALLGLLYGLNISCLPRALHAQHLWLKSLVEGIIFPHLLHVIIISQSNSIILHVIRIYNY